MNSKRVVENVTSALKGFLDESSLQKVSDFLRRFSYRYDGHYGFLFLGADKIPTSIAEHIVQLVDREVVKIDCVSTNNDAFGRAHVDYLEDVETLGIDEYGFEDFQFPQELRNKLGSAFLFPAAQMFSRAYDKESVHQLLVQLYQIFVFWLYCMKHDLLETEKGKAIQELINLTAQGALFVGFSTKHENTAIIACR